jgi:predicted Zn-dependent protease
MKVALLALNLLFLSACNPAKTTQADLTSANINKSAPYMWSSSAFPRTFKISEDFLPNEVTNIKSVTGAWETSVQNKKNFFNDTERTPEISSSSLNLDAIGDDNINGIYKITSWPLGLSSGALAVTQIFGRRLNVGAANEYVRIEHADILINENLYDFRTGDTGSSNSYDLRTVVLHELGHFLGLSHKYGSTVMVPSITSGTNIRTPTSIDATDMADKYSITLGTGTGAAVMAGKRIDYSSSPSDQGQPIKLIIELMADGECVHKENGAVIERHFPKY